MNENTKEKSCANCVFFWQHYILSMTRLKSTDWGHCINKRGKSKKPDGCCGNWKQKPDEKEARKRKVKDAIVAISHDLDKLVMILDCDSDE